MVIQSSERGFDSHHPRNWVWSSGRTAASAERHPSSQLVVIWRMFPDGDGVRLESGSGYASSHRFDSDVLLHVTLPKGVRERVGSITASDLRSTVGSSATLSSGGRRFDSSRKIRDVLICRKAQKLSGHCLATVTD